MRQSVSPFAAVCILFAVAIGVTLTCITATEVFHSRLLRITYTPTLISVIDELPVLLKFSNLALAHYGFIRDLYFINIIILLSGLVGSYMALPGWRFDFILNLLNDDFARDSFCERQRVMRTLTMTVLIVVVLVFSFDFIAVNPLQRFRNQLHTNPWSGIRLPIMISMIYAASLYLSLTWRVAWIIGEVLGYRPPPRRPGAGRWEEV